VGALRLDAAKGGVDVLCACDEKWMLNPHVGSGFMHISKELLEGLNPAPYGI
jgi:selenocysteine lyase/cysteine desulfurase